MYLSCVTLMSMLFMSVVIGINWTLENKTWLNRDALRICLLSISITAYFTSHSGIFYKCTSITVNTLLTIMITMLDKAKVQRSGHRQSIGIRN